MWGPTPAPPLGTRSALGLPLSQPGTTSASRLAEDAALLDFPDWDGPGDGPCLPPPSPLPFPRPTPAPISWIKASKLPAQLGSWSHVCNLYCLANSD